ncbi:hypothetical protein FUMI01_30770 [Flavobacterium sp. UMI-01]|nr:hypothetical protein FUMI01_30770 [Flavobacterium sp. UMI-01]
MKSFINNMMAMFLLLSVTFASAQIKNAKTETVKIYGNCGMCKKTIEKAANLKGVATVNWNVDTKMATLNYDATKTNQDEILKRIANAGYDSDKFPASNTAYNQLPKCCQYDRAVKQEKSTCCTNGKSQASCCANDKLKTSCCMSDKGKNTCCSNDKGKSSCCTNDKVKNACCSI